MRNIILATKGMCNCMNISNIRFGKSTACKIRSSEHIFASFLIRTVCIGTVQIFEDQLYGIQCILSGALVGYAADPATVGYQPMHVNFGLVPPLEDGKRRSKRDRYQAYADRALEALDAYLATRPDLFGGDRS